MNDKGQMGMVGAILVTFVGVVVALALLNGGIFGNIGAVTNTQLYNSSTGSGQLTATKGVIQDLVGAEVVSGFYAQNPSGGAIAAGNYTVASRQILNGVLTATINASGENATGAAWNISYVYEPDGYIDDAGGRAIAGLIAVFAALALAVFALIPVFKSDALKMFR